MEEENLGRRVIGKLLDEIGGEWRSGKELAGVPDAEIYLSRWQQDIPDYDVFGMSRDEIEDMLEREYWPKIRGDDIRSPEVAGLILLAVWQLGQAEAIRLVQQAAGVKAVDGVMGAQTLAKLNKWEDGSFISRIKKLMEDSGIRTVLFDSDPVSNEEPFEVQPSTGNVSAEGSIPNVTVENNREGALQVQDLVNDLWHEIAQSHVPEKEKDRLNVFFKEEFYDRLNELDTTSVDNVHSLTNELQEIVAGLDASEEEKHHLQEAIDNWGKRFPGGVPEPANRPAFDVDAIAKKSTSDIWTIEDRLGYESYAQAIAKLIVEGKAEPPLTVSIQAPWGQGKTSLMRMIKHKLENGLASPANEPTREKDKTVEDIPGTQAKLNDLDEWIDKEKQQADAAMLEVDSGSVPCVWFNPLYFQDSKQIWSGLAHAMLHQLADRLPNRLQKERFWFRLRLTRINTRAVRRDIHKLILERLLPKGLVGFLVLLFTLLAMYFGFDTVQAFIDGYPVFKGIPLLGALLPMGWSWLRKNRDWSLDDQLVDYINEPDYQGDLGLLHLVEHDLDRALKLLLGEDGRLVVFIDDLDRCTPDTVNDILLAINQFISVQHRKLYFILGMDTHMVAMAIETAAEKQAATYNKNRHTSKGYGWRFMEKFVQLPFFIPRIAPREAEKFLTDLLKTKREEAVSSEQVDELKKQIEASESLPELQDLVVGFKSKLDIDFLPEIDASVAARMIDMTGEESGEVYARLVDAAMSDLELNPREMKRFLNVARLLFIRVDHSEDVSGDDHMKKIVRASHLILNWPQCLRWLQGNARSYTLQGVKMDPVESLEQLFDDDRIGGYEQWRDAIEKTWGETVAATVAQPDFYAFVERIHAEPPNLGDIFAARIF